VSMHRHCVDECVVWVDAPGHDPRLAPEEREAPGPKARRLVGWWDRGILGGGSRVRGVID
jgi:hypothetical protein